MAKMKLWALIQSRWRLILAVASIAGICVFLLLAQITTLFPAPNSAEAEALTALGTSSPWENPVDAPYYLVARFMDIFVGELTSLRVTSAMFGFATAASLAYVLRQWFTDRIAVAGTLIIVTSSWFLSFSRIGAPFVMGAFWLAALLALGTWRTFTRKPLLTDSLIAVTAGLSLYTPRYAWLISLGFIVLALRRYREFFIIPRSHQWFLPVIFAIPVVPLVYAAFTNQSAIDPILGIVPLPDSSLQYIRNVYSSVNQLFFRGLSQPGQSLGRLPLLDIFSVVMAALGVYYYERHIRLRRSQILFTIGTLALFLVCLTPFAVGKLALLFPIVMLFSVGGIVELLKRWLDSFPRNPIARSVGVCCIVVAIGFTSFYHLQKYFVAWAGNPDTISAHNPGNFESR